LIQRKARPARRTPQFAPPDPIVDAACAHEDHVSRRGRHGHRSKHLVEADGSRVLLDCGLMSR
jgi:hypothetical protein